MSIFGANGQPPVSCQGQPLKTASDEVLVSLFHLPVVVPAPK